MASGICETVGLLLVREWSLTKSQSFEFLTFEVVIVRSLSGATRIAHEWVNGLDQ